MDEAKSVRGRKEVVVGYPVCPEASRVLGLKVMRARAIHEVVLITTRGGRAGEAEPPANIQLVAAPPVRVGSRAASA